MAILNEKFAFFRAYLINKQTTRFSTRIFFSLFNLAIFPDVQILLLVNNLLSIEVRGMKTPGSFD